MSTCKYCGAVLSGRADQQFCDNKNKCKMAYWRKEHRKYQGPQGNTYTVMLSELIELRAKVADQAHTISELEDYNQRLKSLLSIEQQRAKDQEKEISHLKALLDTERRYYDNQPRNFRGWLRKQEPTDLIKRLLSLGDRLPLKGNRAYYLAMVRILNGPESDVPEFEDLWRLLLLSQE